MDRIVFSIRDAARGLSGGFFPADRGSAVLPEFFQERSDDFMLNNFKVFPRLGIAVQMTGMRDSGLLMEALQEHPQVKNLTIDQDDAFRIIPAESFEPMDLLGDIIPDAHLKLVHVDTLQQEGLSGDGVTVGVLDSGVAATPQLQGRILDTAKVDASGLVTQGPVDDAFKHGTAVCGIIAGNGIGVAPKAKIVVMQIARQGTTSLTQIVAALEWLLENHPEIRIVNLSLGKVDNPDTVLCDLSARLVELNKIVACAIGNQGEGTSYTPGNLVECLGIGAVDLDRVVPAFSSGMQMNLNGVSYFKPDLVMPGVAIPTCSTDGKIYVASGTSFAAPMLTGLGALLLERYPQISVTEFKRLLFAACQDLSVPPDRDGHGLPDGAVFVAKSQQD
jgi:subtilisin family serine protease